MAVAGFGKTSIEIVQQNQQNYGKAGVVPAKRSFEEINSFVSAADQLNGRTVPAFGTSNKGSTRDPFLGLNPIRAGKIIDQDDHENEKACMSQAHAQHAALPGPSQNPLLSLSHPSYGLPRRVVDNLASLGIRSIYPWQSSCLLGRGLLQGQRNLVYTAPTGGGKSLVADVLLLKRVIETPGKKAIVVLPYVALVLEKLKWLQRVLEGVGKLSPNADGTEIPQWRRKQNDAIQLVGYFAGSKIRAPWRDVDIAVCTIEKVTTFLVLRRTRLSQTGQRSNQHGH
ncbi:MAG: hypothetical protein OHK93_007633 [Ramalina farinacea]|uniref:DEAD/DEAH-box helicase domain-containing protein n=1 Tax=Ramalina farinacea TaxID=258253 RepID=A0AA43TU95_9LECA|nr:hypothetical protein [Ramalina farinacea]